MVGEKRRRAVAAPICGSIHAPQRVRTPPIQRDFQGNRANGNPKSSSKRKGCFGFWIWTRRFLIAQFLLLHAALAQVDLSPTWRWSNPTPHGANIVNMAYENGLYVQVGERGQIFTSEDLPNWIPRDSHTTAALRAVTFFNGQIVITGENGTVLVADDPAYFLLMDLDTTDWLEGVAASSNLVVAVGDNAAIYISTNALDWSRVVSSFNDWLRCVAYGTNTFVAVGENGLVATSLNGRNWQARSSGTTAHLNRVAWMRNQFFAVGDGGATLASADGIHWQTTTIGIATNNLYAATAGSGSLLVAGDLEVWANDNGWSNQLTGPEPLPAPAWTYYSALWDDTQYLLTGRSGMIVEGFKTNSTGSFLWVPESDPIRTWLWQVARFPDYYLAVGDHGSVLSSINGIDWEIELVPAPVTNSVLLGIGGATNLMVAVGSRGTIVWATNAYAWHQVLPPPATNDLQGITYSEGMFIACGGQGVILTSRNGLDWTRRATPVSSLLSSVCAVPGGFVVVGDAGGVLLSLDGERWEPASSGTTNWLFQVRLLNGVLVAVGENGTILTSTNGVQWAARSSGTDRWLNAVEFIEGLWLVAGNQGTMLASTNLITWTNLGTLTKKSLYGLAVHQGQVVTVGAEGVILRSQLIPPQAPVHIQAYSRPSNQNLFLFTGQPDQQFFLRSSEDFQTWTDGPLLEFPDSTGTLLFLQSPETNAVPKSFYSTRLPR